MAVGLRWLALVLLAPLAVVLLGMQVAAFVAAWGMGHVGLAVIQKSSNQLDTGASALATSAQIVDRTWSSPAGTLLRLNPMSLGTVDDIQQLATAVAVASKALDPLARLAALGLGFDGQAKLVSGSTINVDVVPALQQPTRELNKVLTETDQALAEVHGDGALGGPFGSVSQQWRRIIAPLTQITESMDLAFPTLPEALGSKEPKRYLICALNDGEVFGSGGAPLAAAMVEVVDGAVSVPVSGQLESKLSPNNPPIKWKYAGGEPWYRASKSYPFVNSDFPPDFRTAAIDMRRAWAGLGYPAVDGVITVDVTALSRILAWTGPVRTNGYGEVTKDNLVRKILVDAYRDYNSLEGVEQRHQMNGELAAALAQSLTQPLQIMGTISGAMSAIPDRHIQANFESAGIQAAVANLGAAGRLANEPGDLVGVFSQSGPNKLSIFQERDIQQEILLTPGGGAKVTQTVTITNAVPADLRGELDSFRGYTALKARLRVAFRIPTDAKEWTLDIGEARPLVGLSKVGPYPDGSGGKVLWQGFDIPARDRVTVTITYRLPRNTWSQISGLPIYSVAADPQALNRPAHLTIRVSAAPGAPNPAAEGGWRSTGNGVEWTGRLDRAIRLNLRAVPGADGS